MSRDGCGEGLWASGVVIMTRMEGLIEVGGVSEHECRVSGAHECDRIFARLMSAMRRLAALAISLVAAAGALALRVEHSLFSHREGRETQDNRIGFLND